MDLTKFKDINSGALFSSYRDVDDTNFQDGDAEKYFRVTSAKNDTKKKSSRSVSKRTGRSKATPKTSNKTGKAGRKKIARSSSSGSTKRESSPESMNQDEEQAKNKPTRKTGNALAGGTIPKNAPKSLRESSLKSKKVTFAKSWSSQEKPIDKYTSQDVHQSPSDGPEKGRSVRSSQKRAKSGSVVLKRKEQKQPAKSQGKKSARKRSKSPQKRRSQSRKRSGNKRRKSVKSATKRKRRAKKKQ